MILVLFNGVSDLSKLVENGYSIPRNVQYFDPFVGARWCWPDAYDNSLEHLALRLTNVGQWRPYGKLSAEDFDTISDDDLSKRCGGDADAALRLYPIIKDEIKTLKLEKIFSLAMDVLPILSEMGGRGMAVDSDELSKRAFGDGNEEGLETKLKKEKKDLEAILEIENLASRAQLASSLFERHKATPLRATATGGYSTDRVSLLWALHNSKDTQLSKLLQRLLEYSTESKLYSTYYLPWSRVGRNARVRSNYNLGTTGTGRLASSHLNLQNVPSIVRELIRPSDGYDYLVQLDGKQIEWRMAAFLSNDKAMLESIKPGRDPHSMTAATALGMDIPKTGQQIKDFKVQYKPERDIGKMTNFASIFGVSDESLSWQTFEQSEGKIWLGKAKAKVYLDAFGRTFPGWTSYLGYLQDEINRGNWIVSPTGRRWIFEKNPSGLRKASNYPVQSLSSDIILLILRAIAKKISWWKTRVIGEVHDSILFETTKHELQPLCNVIKDLFCNPDTSEFGFHLTVPLEVDIQVGDRWGNMEEMV